MAFINGVDTAAKQITSLGTQVGSYLGDVGTSIEVDDIIVAKNGAVIKVTVANDANTYTYEELSPIAPLEVTGPDAYVKGVASAVVGTGFNNATVDFQVIP